MRIYQTPDITYINDTYLLLLLINIAKIFRGATFSSRVAHAKL